MTIFAFDNLVTKEKANILPAHHLTSEGPFIDHVKNISRTKASPSRPFYKLFEQSRRRKKENEIG